MNELGNLGQPHILLKADVELAYEEWTWEIGLGPNNQLTALSLWQDVSKMVHSDFMLPFNLILIFV